MANVAPPYSFSPHPVHYATNPFGFGFGSSSSNTPTPSTSTTMNAPWPGPTPSQAAVRPQKRRLEADDSQSGKRGRSDDAMDRSPTPERPKRAAPKRARPNGAADADEKNGKENKPPGSDGNDDVDVGVLLASLPSQTLLPILTSLLETHPSLKPSVLSLIPRPTIDTALEALNRSAKKLRDAYPYSNNTSSSGAGFGFGARPVAAAPSTPTPGGTSFGFGRPPSFGQPSPFSQQSSMRDTYVASRLQTHITEFIAACMSYLPYFSYSLHPSSSSSSTAQKLHNERSHPSETYMFLEALTSHFFSQPPLTQRSLGPSLIPRLLQEWRAWVDVVDETVNRKAGMFGGDTVRSWEAGLDRFSEMKEEEGGMPMKEIRNLWVAKVGWLVGRRVVYAMDE